MCCHNSARRLPEALRCLQRQEVPTNVHWEVVVVDNASTDGTAEVAGAVWAEKEIVPFRLAREPEIGLTHARMRGFEEASHDLVSFVDDDNWVGPDWVRTVAEVATNVTSAGAFGGVVEDSCETAAPWWLERFGGSYGIGTQGEQAGDVTETRGSLFGAGLSIRRSAWLQLMGCGFEPLLTDRKGSSLDSGGDSELCFAIRLAGWKLWYEPRLFLRHYLPATRLRWDYLRRLFRGFGVADVSLDPYREALGLRRRRHFGGWRWEYARTLARLSCHPLLYLQSKVGSCEGREDVLLLEGMLGRMQELLQQRNSYDSGFERVRKLKERLDAERAGGT